MGLFSSPVAEININYYGQKRRNKAVSNVQIHYNVTMTPNNLDPRYLGDLYSKAFVLYASIHNMPVERDLFWTYVNESFKNLAVNPTSLFYIWPGFLDVVPLMGQPGGKPCCFVKATLMDNGKMKYKYTENAVTLYYNTLAPIAVMQHIINILPPDQFAIFYEVFCQRMAIEVQNSSDVEMLRFKLDPLPVLGMAPVQQVQAVGQQPAQGGRFCGGCGASLTLGDGSVPKFCGSCGNPVG